MTTRKLKKKKKNRKRKEKEKVKISKTYDFEPCMLFALSLTVVQLIEVCFIFDFSRQLIISSKELKNDDLIRKLFRQDLLNADLFSYFLFKKSSLIVRDSHKVNNNTNIFAVAYYFIILFLIILICLSNVSLLSIIFPSTLTCVTFFRVT